MVVITRRPAPPQPRTPWRIACERRDAKASNKVDAALWRIAASDFERLCEPERVADLPSLLPQFSEALRREGVDSSSIAMYLQLVGEAVRGRADP
jgi:hypothetical protein